MKKIKTISIKFPDIQLSTRDAHKLRGYFGNLFKKHSPLLHNHYEDGQLRYQYPLVQYKVVEKVPILLGLGEGADLLLDLFLKIKEIKIESQHGEVKTYAVHSKNIETREHAIGLQEDLQQYRFQTLWMALNQKNYSEYVKANVQKKDLLKRIAISNILAFYKSFGHFLAEHERILLTLQVDETTTKFKDNEMIAFKGSFTTNALLPDHIGIGKAVARGFGTIQKIK